MYTLTFNSENKVYRNTPEPDRAGTNAMVHYIDNNWIRRKSFTSTDGFQYIPDLIKRYGHSKHLPNIDMDESDILTMSFRVERLHRVPWALWYYKSEETCDFMQQMNNIPYMSDEERENFYNTIDTILDAKHPFREPFKWLLEVVERYRKDTGCFLKIDADPSNIMMRRNGDLVWSDPFTCLVSK